MKNLIPTIALFLVCVTDKFFVFFDVLTCCYFNPANQHRLLMPIMSIDLYGFYLNG